LTQQKLSTAQAVGQQPDWGALLDLLARNLGDNLVLELCRLQHLKGGEKAPASGAPASGANDGLGEQFLLEISGLARTQSDVSDCVLRLEKAGLFDRVKLIKTNRHSFLSGKAVAFDLECTFQGGGGATP
jgi:Tfp pilus assembly protein PilN